MISEISQVFLEDGWFLSFLSWNKPAIYQVQPYNQKASDKGN